VARVAVVIPSWNGRELLDVVLPTLAGQTYRDFRTLIVDNGSTDGSVDHLRREWPEVEVLALPHNIGFAAAINRAIEESDEELVALLNNDIELEREWLGELVAAMDAHPGAASAGSKLVDFHDRSMLDGTGDLMMWSGICVRRGFGETDLGQYDAPEEVFSACAGAAVYRRAAFDDVGTFDEDFFAYLEDVDWGFRARLRGWGCRYVPTSVAYHMGGATTRRQSDLELYLCRRNQIALVLKNYPRGSLVRYGWLVLSDLFYALLVAIRDRKVMRQLRSWRDAARQLPATMHKRAEIQAGRRAGHAELRSVLVPPRITLRALVPGQSHHAVRSTPQP
jgi:GT2 family glycosyltransferase